MLTVKEFVQATRDIDTSISDSRDLITDLMNQGYGFDEALKIADAALFAEIWKKLYLRIEDIEQK